MARMMNKVTLLRKPQDGQSIKGDRGVALRGPLDWAECSSSNPNFHFEAGGPNDDYLDFVVYNGNYYMCTTSHYRSQGWVSSYWQTAANLPFVASWLILTRYLYSEYLGAGAIIMKDENGNVVFSAQGGKVFALDGEFRGHIIAGDPNGMHVELDPSTPAMKVYNASGQECTSHTGEVTQP